ncbi:hypothetical protein L1049_017173 [Liquidambar formosana]|uniref:Uncharacterized protein n=1 Tax=Liquidambar formosana TaxID=63359 RepID=A0AAP0S7G1_LIQFO
MSVTHKMLMQLMLLVGLLLATTVAQTTAQAKPGCLDRCGDVGIPYPFGTKDGCYLNESFLITCNDSFNPPKAFLRESDINVTRISLQGQLNILQYMARDCYDENGVAAVDNSNNPSLTLSYFTISETENKFVAVGCDTYAILEGFQIDGTKYTTGCMSICNNLDYVNDSCSGTGCCQVSIPKRLWAINLTLSSYYNHSGVWDFNPCSYAFVVEQKAFHFSANYLRNLQYKEELETVVDWAIGNETCQVARKNETSYACKGNSTCHENENGSGYLCQCLKGHQGNPYLDGCQDIDECTDSNLNQCEKPEYCINVVGNFTCSCPKGYHGDARKNGKGCIANPFQVVQVAVGSGICAIVVLVGSWWLYFGIRKRKLMKLKEKFFQQNGGAMLQLELSRRDISNGSAKIFTVEELKKATNNYDEYRIIGRGGYGTVYKGFLADKSMIAIKKSKMVNQSQIEQFINEVLVLTQINHRNVVRLLGCCLETEVPLLVYEFVTNGTLFDHIHDKSKASSISWETRLRIATETAGVLSYLHSATSTPIIHRDVKSTNILLDDNYVAKVSDFGASRLVPLDQTQLSTMVQGTFGYMDPEYFHTSQLTEKSDVYSFGVVLVELLTGRKAICFDRPEKERSLVMYFLSSLKENCLFQVVENCILNEGNTVQIKEVANVAKKCLRVKGDERPTMKEVAIELEGLRMMEMHPWVGVELNLQEVESLLGESSHNFNHGDGNNLTGRYDSVRNHLILPVSDGR